MQRPFASAVTALSADAGVGSALEQGTTLLPCDLRQRDLQRALETTSTLCGRQEPSAVERHALATGHTPLQYRFIVAQGASLHAKHHRMDGTPESQDVSTSQPRSHSVSRLACDRAVGCGVSLRHLALLCAVLCLIPMSKASLKRWMDAMGGPLAHARGEAAATACARPGDGVSHGWRRPAGHGPRCHGRPG